MREINFLEGYQRATPRNYIERVTAHDKAACAEIARQWGADYWDGARHHGYGGYRYDGRWRPVAEEIAAFYGLKAGDRILDIGCGKAFLLHEFAQAVPGLIVAGIDISTYAIARAKADAGPLLAVARAEALPWPDDSFDFVFSINTFHNLPAPALQAALREIERVGRGKSWLCVESFRNEREKMNLLYWQLTCASFHDVETWKWLCREWGYTGDCGFIFFE